MAWLPELRWLWCMVCCICSSQQEFTARITHFPPVDMAYVGILMSFHDLWTEKRVIKNYIWSITRRKMNGAQESLRHNVHISCRGYLASENSSWSCFPDSFLWFINGSLGGYQRTLAKLIFWHHVWLPGSGSKSSALSFSKPIKKEVQVPEQCFLVNHTPCSL